MLQTPNSNETASIKARCLKIIDGFQHREALNEADIRTWLSDVVGAQGEAAIWHAARAAGFGGSDIGILVRNFQGHRADHMASAHKIVESKLLKSVPDEDHGDLRRGHENEPGHALKYYAKYAAKRDEEAFQKLTSSQGLRSWMRYSPDDVVLVPAPQANPALGGAFARRLLIDYKAPRKVEADESVAFQYACQLHQGAMICAKAGIHLDGLQLSQYDWAGWQLKDDAIPYDRDISSLILQAGDHYYDHVMRGQLPAYIFTPKFEREQEFIEKFGLRAQRLAQLSATAKAFTDAYEKEAKAVKDFFQGVRLAGTKMQLGDLGVTAVAMVDHEKIHTLLGKEGVAALRKKNAAPEYDAKAMVEKLKGLGVDTNEFRIDKLDADKAYPALVEMGHDAESFMTEQIRFKVAEYLKVEAAKVVELSFPVEIEQPVEMLQDAGQVTAELPAEEDVREGQSTERHSQRAAMV